MLTVNQILADVELTLPPRNQLSRNSPFERMIGAVRERIRSIHYFLEEDEVDLSERSRRGRSIAKSPA